MRSTATSGVRLEIDHVNKVFGSFEALRPTTVDIKPGEFVSVVGPSGCGKSTLMLMVAGLLKTSQGAIRVDGKPVQLHFIGSENEADGTWSYFQVNDVPSVKKIDAGDDLLYDGFNQQINIMHVTVGGQRQSTRLDYPEANASFQF